MPGPLAEVNVHLIDLDEGYLLIDTGWGSDESFAALEAGLAQRGVAWADIRTLLVTHLHPDHVGNAAQVLDRSGARFLMHRVDAANLARLIRHGRSPFFEEAWRIAGVPAELQQKLDKRFHAATRTYPSCEPALALEGGERISVRGGVLEVIWTPGHSAGHVCLYSPEHRYLIAGDHLLEFTTPNVGWRPGEDMLAKFLDSLYALQALEIDWILPSHGAPFRDHRERIQAMAGHHDERCRRILEHIAGPALTAQSIVERVWPQRLGLVDHNLAILEILAHLEYLRRRGPVSAEPQADGSLLWRQSA